MGVGRPKVKLEIGKQYGKLIILDNILKNKRLYGLIKCECGVEKLMYKSNIKKYGSCGCGIKEIGHGFSNTRFYRIYRNIKNRCEKEYFANRYWNGKGIKCEWKTFEDFRDEMYESYLEHYKKFGENNTTIDRIKNHLNYCKNNCRWATLIEQSNNRDCVKNNL